MFFPLKGLDMQSTTRALASSADSEGPSSITSSWTYIQSVILEIPKRKLLHKHMQEHKSLPQNQSYNTQPVVSVILEAEMERSRN